MNHNQSYKMEAQLATFHLSPISTIYLTVEHRSETLDKRIKNHLKKHTQTLNQKSAF